MLVKDITMQKCVKDMLKDANATNKNLYFNPYTTNPHTDKAFRVIRVVGKIAHLINGVKIDLTDRYLLGSDFFIN